LIFRPGFRQVRAVCDQFATLLARKQVADPHELVGNLIGNRVFDQVCDLNKGKGKGFPYSIPSVGPGADPGTGSQPAGDRKSSTRRQAAITFRQACSYLPSRRASPLFGRYQVILLGDRGT